MTTLAVLIVLVAFGTVSVVGVAAAVVGYVLADRSVPWLERVLDRLDPYIDRVGRFVAVRLLHELPRLPEARLLPKPPVTPPP